MKITRVSIIGKGAVGLLYGSLIAKNIGEDCVEFVMDDARYARHANDEVYVNGRPCRIRTVPASEAAPADAVILAVKATGLAQAINTMEALCTPTTRIASLLNGITSEERIARRFGWERCAVSVAQGMDAVFLDNRLTFSHPGEIRFGAAPLTAPGVVEDLADLYRRAGIRFTVEEDIRHRQWTKLMLNAGVNQTCMAYSGTYGSVMEAGSEQNRCFIAAMREVMDVARAEGVELTEDDLTQMVKLVASLDPDGMPSMAQDRINRKRTEVEEFAGTVIRLANKHGILVPQNRFLYERITDIEAEYRA